jgi:hypothetical protein
MIEPTVAVIHQTTSDITGFLNKLHTVDYGSLRIMKPFPNEVYRPRVVWTVEYMDLQGDKPKKLTLIFNRQTLLWSLSFSYIFGADEKKSREEAMEEFKQIIHFIPHVRRQHIQNNIARARALYKADAGLFSEEEQKLLRTG